MNPATLLTTKLYFPPVRPSLVPRLRLVERLQSGLSGPLTLISAPAGSGKTTLLSEWRAGPGVHYPAAWLSLDSGDNDPNRFFHYLTTCLDTLQPGLAQEVLPLLQTSDSPRPEVILTPLINTLNNYSQDFLLVLDDYHVIDNPDVHAALTFMLDHLPAQMHIVLMTRSDPPLPLTRMRARGHLLEIRAEHLLFNMDECIQFLNQVMGLNLSLDQAAVLENRTEGWIASLQLAALSMQGRDDLQAFVTAFAGSHHYIMDYLIEEVLNRQPDQVREFLLKTSILDHLTGELCDTLTGQYGGQLTLEMLLHANLFLVPLDDGHLWFRYHHLFSDLLSILLHRKVPDIIPGLHLRASSWYEQAGMLGDAVRHALLAKDYIVAARLLKQHGIRIARENNLFDMYRWMEELPAEVWNTDADLNFIRTLASWSLRRMDDVNSCLNRIEKILYDQEQTDPEVVHTPEFRLMSSNVLGIRSRTVAYKNDWETAIKLAMLALDSAPEGANLQRAITYPSLYTSYRSIGDIEKAIYYCEQAIHFCKAADHRVLAVDSIANLAQMQITQGRLHKAIEVVEDGLKYLDTLHQRELPSYSILYAMKAHVLTIQHELDSAESFVQQAIKLSQKSGRPANELTAQLIFVDILAARGDLDTALQNLDKAATMLDAVGRDFIPFLKEQLEWTQALITAQTGNLSPASALADTFEKKVDSQTPFFDRRKALGYAKILLVLNRLDEAAEILQGLEPICEKYGHMGWMVEVLAVQALVYYKKSSLNQALTTLQRAISLAEPEGYRSIFIAAGSPMRELLQLSRSKGIAAGFIAQLLAAAPSKVASHSSRKSPLSSREVELLKLIATGRSNKEIATRLVISLGTVKRHTVNIFNKLDASNRTEAVAKARELGLI